MKLADFKKDGEVLMIDWSESFGGMGPTSQNIVTEAIAREMFEKRGFKFGEKISTSAHHYGIIFKYE